MNPASNPVESPTTPQSVLRGAMPPARRFWPGAASAFLSEASAVALLAVSAWLIVRASEQPLVMYITAAVVGVRLFALTRAAFRYPTVSRATTRRCGSSPRRARRSCGG